MYNICAVTGSRADYGLLKNTLLLLKHNKNVQLKLVVTGSHLDEKYGMTVNEIIDDGFTDYYEIPINNYSDDRRGMAKSVSDIVDRLSAYFMENDFDLFLVLGDRYEAFASCVAASIMNILIAHISGGDVTEGAIDDVFRHSMTKMSSIHFTGCADSRRRVIQMGENPEMVFDVGEPGVENALNTKLLTQEELADFLGDNRVCEDFALLTFHPATMDGDSKVIANQLTELITAIKKLPQLTFLVTLANADASGLLINELWAKAQGECDNIIVVPSLGVVRYLSAMKYCRFVIGNSSSGIVEAPAFGKPTVNIGDRQKGRMMASSIINCNPLTDDIIKAVNKALSHEFSETIKGVKSPFGEGNTSKEIVSIIIDCLNRKQIRAKKAFYDMTN